MGTGPDLSRSTTDSAARVRRADEQRVRLLAAVRRHAFFLLDASGVIQQWDVGGEQIEGHSAAPLTGQHFSVLYPPAQVREGKPDTDLGLAADIGTFEEEGWRVRRDGRRFRARVVIDALRAGDGRLVGYTQVTEDLSERQAVEALERELTQEKAAGAEAEASAHRMRTVLEASRLLSVDLDPAEGVQRFARLLVPEVADWCTIHLADPDGSVRRVEAIHRDPGRFGRAERDDARGLLDLEPPPGVSHVLRTGKSVLVPEVGEELLVRIARNDAQREVLEHLGVSSAMIVPLLARGYAVGAVTLVAGESGRRFGATDLMLAEELAARAALALDNARLYTDARAELQAREAAEAELRSAHTRMEVILQGVRSGITVQDASGRIVYANDAAGEMVGYASGRALQEAPIFEVLRRLEIMDASGAALPRSELPGRRPLSDPVEERVLRYRVKATGAEYWARVRSTAVVSGDDREVLSINIFHDITERVQVEQARQEEARIIDALHRIGQSLAQQLDREAIVREVTDTATTLTEAEFGVFFYQLGHGEGACYTSDATSGASEGVFQSFLMPHDAWLFSALLDEPRVLLSDDVTVDLRDRVGWLRGLLPETPRFRSLLAVPVLSHDAQGIGALVLGHGAPAMFSERHERLATGVAGWASVAMDNARLYEEEHLARAAAEEANKVKASFLATVSHELRTPLNGMIGYVDLLLQGIPETIPRGPREKVQRIGANALHLRELIEELLIFSRLEAGQEVAHIEPVELRALFDEVQALIEPLAQHEGLRLDVHRPERPLRVASDARRLRQILLNLLGNAIKFTGEGEVVLRADDAGEDVLIRVMDTGPGIDAAEFERVFEPFYQIDRTASRPVAGTGLGLTVTRRLARLLGGDVTVWSGPGRGSTFTLRLPARGPHGGREEPTTGTPGPAPSPPGGGPP